MRLPHYAYQKNIINMKIFCWDKVYERALKIEKKCVVKFVIIYGEEG